MRGAPVHEGHAEKTRRRLAVLLVFVHVVLAEAAHQQPRAAGLVRDLFRVEGGERLERDGGKLLALFSSVSLLPLIYSSLNIRILNSEDSPVEIDFFLSDYHMKTYHNSPPQTLYTMQKVQ